MGDIKKIWDDFVSGKIAYSDFSDSGLVMTVDLFAETYDIIIGDREPLADGLVDPAKIYRGVKSSIPFSTMSFNVGDAVLVGYQGQDRNHPLVIGRSDNIIMDIEKVTINPPPPPPGTSDLFIMDGSNYRIKRHETTTGLAYVAQQGAGQGIGNEEYSNNTDVTTDGTFLYFVDRNPGRIMKRNLSDLTYVSHVYGKFSDPILFINPYDVTTDGTYLYVLDKVGGSAWRIVKLLAADLSLVAQVAVETYRSGITTDGTYVYTTSNISFATEHITKRRCSDLGYDSGVSLITDFDDVESDGASIWTLRNGTNGGIDKYNPTTFALEASIVFTAGDPYKSATQIAVDESFIYTGSGLNLVKYAKAGFGGTTTPVETIETPAIGMSGNMDFYGITGMVSGNFKTFMSP